MHRLSLQRLRSPPPGERKKTDAGGAFFLHCPLFFPLGMATVFVYGTLMADEVVRALIHRVPRARPAVVSGYRRHALRGQVFPGTVPAGATDTVTGKVRGVCVCVCGTPGEEG